MGLKEIGNVGTETAVYGVRQAPRSTSVVDEYEGEALPGMRAERRPSPAAVQPAENERQREPIEEPVVEPVPPEPTCPDVPYAELLCAYEWDPWTAARIVACESRYDPGAVGAGSYGLFQIQASVHSWKWGDFWDRWMDPVRNAEYAWEIYQGRGWYAWSCF